jgi:hypothetical protein
MSGHTKFADLNHKATAAALAQARENLQKVLRAKPDPSPK